MNEHLLVLATHRRWLHARCADLSLGVRHTTTGSATQSRITNHYASYRSNYQQVDASYDLMSIHRQQNFSSCVVLRTWRLDKSDVVVPARGWQDLPLSVGIPMISRPPSSEVTYIDAEVCYNQDYESLVQVDGDAGTACSVLE